MTIFCSLPNWETETRCFNYKSCNQQMKNLLSCIFYNHTFPDSLCLFLPSFNFHPEFFISTSYFEIFYISIHVSCREIQLSPGSCIQEKLIKESFSSYCSLPWKASVCLYGRFYINSPLQS